MFMTVKDLTTDCLALLAVMCPEGTLIYEVMDDFLISLAFSLHCTFSCSENDSVG